MFVGREYELGELEQWWASSGLLAMVWGRRRVGKTWLLHEFSRTKPHLFYVATGKPLPAEMRQLSDVCRDAGLSGMRDLEARPFESFDDALEHLAGIAQESPLLVVLDEFPEAISTDPHLPNSLRAFKERLAPRSGLKVVLCGSAVRTMHSLAEEREPLFGRFALRLHVHPFPLWDFARLLPDVAPVDVAIAYGLFGGTPLYASWWTPGESVQENISRTMCHPSSRALTEGELILATEADTGNLPRRVLEAIAAGRTRFSEIRDWVDADPGRTLEHLSTLRLIARKAPVTDDERNARKVRYEISDPFLDFYLRTLTKYRPAIERGLGQSIAPVLREAIDNMMGPRFEKMALEWVTHKAAQGEYGDHIVAVGPWWKNDSTPELDIVALQGAGRTPRCVGEVKWSRDVDAARELSRLRDAATFLPGASGEGLAYILVGRERFSRLPTDAPNVHTYTVADLITQP